jgi:hypothetical protein
MVHEVAVDALDELFEGQVTPAEKAHGGNLTTFPRTTSTGTVSAIRPISGLERISVSV